MLIYVIYRVIQHNASCETVYTLCEFHLHLSDKLLHDIDYIQVSKQHITTAYQEFHSNYAFQKHVHKKLMKLV